jgi:hypothetical protein
MAGMRYELIDGNRARRLTGELRDLYAEVYAEPPYLEGPQHVAAFARTLTRELDLPGFALAAALDGSLLAGAAYGFTLPPGAWMEPRAADPPPQLLDTAKLNVAEWMVRVGYRSGRVGRRLLDMLLTDRPESLAVLASNPEAPARQIYERWGWTPVGQIVPKTMPPMDVLIRHFSSTR